MRPIRNVFALVLVKTDPDRSGKAQSLTPGLEGGLCYIQKTPRSRRDI